MFNYILIKFKYSDAYSDVNLNLDNMKYDDVSNFYLLIIYYLLK